MILREAEVKVAYSMVYLARHSSDTPINVYQSFLCYWAAFNNIYTTIHDKYGLPKRDYEWDENQMPRMPHTSRRGGVDVPRVTLRPTEWEQIRTAYSRFSGSLRHNLITHPSTPFFAYRTPRWNGQPIEKDQSEQRVNGVINVGHTLDQTHPVWSPLDTTIYEAYLSDPTGRANLRGMLTGDIVAIIFTVRNNLSHGGKVADDRDDEEVVEKAIPLLRMIVQGFLIPFPDDN